MTTNPQAFPLTAVPATDEPRQSRDHLRLSKVSRRVTMALAALVLSVGGQVARAGEAGPPSGAPTALPGTGASKGVAQGFSARSLVAQAEADLAAGHPGLAILGYERARLLAPRAPTVTAGLARAQSMAGLPSAEASPAVRFMGRFDANEWGWMGMAGLVLAGAGLIALSWGLIRRRGFLVLALGGAGLAGVGFVSAVEVTPRANQAVVVAANAVARIAPFAKADQAFAVPEGAIVTVERTYGSYALIANPEGRGWIPEGGLEIILPASGKHS